MKRLWKFLKWWFTPENYEAHTVNRVGWVQKLESGFQFGFLALWCFWVARDVMTGNMAQAVVDGIFLVHRAWCAWRWYKYLRDHDDDDDDDKGTPIPVWKQALMGA